ncbi:hypothetical protein BD309DRAFT_970409 [Dichomitus squalens]|uniref:Uncharacterized protein n=1 Tax=Dichomitus squalens TaxID=114155 RepID=A0A4Q9NDK6_9APHY|nr:hypothetical protein BD311DRAFT_747432 [Dichomitus squalens]TBU39114.1 hypothetical protein BD309DRAFT_970409 [Dichomitus squalens]TBU53382.1 hypothetical protein BD310DRAFT_938222 [Dichomitus squalens]
MWIYILLGALGYPAWVSAGRNNLVWVIVVFAPGRLRGLSSADNVWIPYWSGPGYLRTHRLWYDFMWDLFVTCLSSSCERYPSECCALALCPVHGLNVLSSDKMV